MRRTDIHTEKEKHTLRNTHPVRTEGERKRRGHGRKRER